MHSIWPVFVVACALYLFVSVGKVKDCGGDSVAQRRVPRIPLLAPSDTYVFMIINVCVYVCMCVCMHVRMYRHKIHRQMDRLFKLHAEAPESATLTQCEDMEE